jgi:hypothetical protein
MAKLTGPIGFTGKLEGLSAYNRRGSDKVILRRRYGPSKKDIRTKPCFANTRRVNKEFGGRSSASKWIRDGFFYLRPIEDYNVLASLNGLVQTIQRMDTQTEYGKRSVALSLDPGLLEGFPMNLRHPFESVVRNPVEYSLSREQFRASIHFPALIPSVNFFPPQHHPYFRIVATLSLVPDLYFNDFEYRCENDYSVIKPIVAQTEWMAVRTGAEALSLELQMPTVPPNDQFSLMLCAGVQMGTAKSTTVIDIVKYTGSGKIMAVV